MCAQDRSEGESVHTGQGQSVHIEQVQRVKVYT